MRNLKLCAILLIASITSVYAQTPKENLEKAVEIYNADRTYQDGLNPKTLTDDQVATVKSRMDQGLALLDKVLREGNADQIKVARYFNTNFRYGYLFILGMKGRNADAFEINKAIEADMLRYSESDFPLSYDYFGKQYNIKWENFSSTQAEYLTGMSEISYNLSKYPESIRFGKLALAHSAVSSYFKYISVNKMLDVNVKSPGALTETEKLDFALQSVELYDAQDESTKQIIKDNNYPTAKKGAQILLDASFKDASTAMQERCAKVAPIAAKYDGSKDLALPLYRFCYQHKYAGTEAFDQSALDFAKSSFSTASAANRQAAQELGDAALSALVSRVSSSDCEKLRTYAADYAAVGLASKGQPLDKRFAECVKNREEAARKAEAARKKQERRNNRHFNAYLGIDLVPLLMNVDKMDFGGHLDLRGKHVAHSFGYSWVQKRHDWNSDRAEWDGQHYFYAVKFFAKNSSSPVYAGFLLGYSDKTFVTLPNIQASGTDGSFMVLDLTPVDKQYELMFNSGTQVLGRPFGIDLWFGVGASYNQLSYKELGDPANYSLSGNDFLDSRKKLESINLKMRLGISVGLNFGPKR